MTAKPKISIRKVLQAFVTLVVTTGCIVAVTGASQRQQTKTLRKIDLQIQNGNVRFLDKQDLWQTLVVKRELQEGITPLSALNIQGIEKDARKNPWIADAQVFVNNQEELNIILTQRLPVARIFFENGQSFYLDKTLRLLPLSDLFTYYTAVVTNVPVLKSDSLNKSLRAQIVKLVQFIERDTFWSAQIAHISITPGLKFELIPVLGTHKIIFGDTTNMNEKFNNLFAFYKNVLNRIGWDKYELLDVQFRHQIVASPAIPYKISGRNAISNMDWVKNIMGKVSEDEKPSAPKPKAVSTPEKTITAEQKKPKQEKPRHILPKAHDKKTETERPAGKYIYRPKETN